MPIPEGGLLSRLLGDLIGGLFNRKTRRTGADRSPVRGSDLEAETRISFEDAANGVTTILNIVSDVPCGTCHGGGNAPGTSSPACARCQGTGSISDNQGFFAFSLPCPDCGGRGIRIEKICPKCAGRGVESKRRRIKVKIPPGVDDGSRVWTKGGGGAGTNGGEHGDLHVTVHVAGHGVFSRQGADLLLTVPITFVEAVFGAILTVPTVGGQVVLRVAPGTKSGQIVRATSKGLLKNGRTKERGDLLVTLEIDMPRHLSEGQRKALEEYAKAITVSPRAHLEVREESDQTGGVKC